MMLTEEDLKNLSESDETLKTFINYELRRRPRMSKNVSMTYLEDIVENFQICENIVAILTNTNMVKILSLDSNDVLAIMKVSVNNTRFIKNLALFQDLCGFRNIAKNVLTIFNWKTGEKWNISLIGHFCHLTLLSGWARIFYSDGKVQEVSLLPSYSSLEYMLTTEITYVDSDIKDTAVTWENTLACYCHDTHKIVKVQRTSDNVYATKLIVKSDYIVTYSFCGAYVIFIKLCFSL